MTTCQKRKCKTLIARMLLPVFLCAILLAVAPQTKAETVKTYGDNLVFNNGTLDGILAEGETERTLTNDWGISYPVATFGGVGGDSPAKVRNVDGNAVLVLECTTGGFASYFADLYADGTTIAAGTYRLSMDLQPQGSDFETDNVGFNLYNQYSDVRIYDGGWQNCTELENGWLHYEQEFAIAADSVDSIQMWFNTMGHSSLYVDNLSLCLVTEQDVTPVEPTLPDPTDTPDPTEATTAPDSGEDDVPPTTAAPEDGKDDVPPTTTAPEGDASTPTTGQPEEDVPQDPAQPDEDDGEEEAPTTETIVKFGENLVFNNGTMDGILADGETERTLTNDWGISYPVATFGGIGGDSPAKIKNINGNNVIVLEYSTGNFASYFADLYADGTTVPAGTYELSMDLKPVGDFTTDNVGYNLYSQYTDIRIYDNGWQNCTELEDGWLHYSITLDVAEGGVDSIQMWCNTMGTSTLYVDNISLRAVQTEDVPPKTDDAGSVWAYALAAMTAVAGIAVLTGKKKFNSAI